MKSPIGYWIRNWPGKRNTFHTTLQYYTNPVCDSNSGLSAYVFVLFGLVLISDEENTNRNAF